MGFERSDLSVRVHPIADALDAVEPQRAARVAIAAGIVAQVAVLAAARAHLCQPFAFGCGEFHRVVPDGDELRRLETKCDRSCCQGSNYLSMQSSRFVPPLSG